jgi:hypothetical protein
MKLILKGNWSPQTSKQEAELNMKVRPNPILNNISGVADTFAPTCTQHSAIDEVNNACKSSK